MSFPLCLHIGLKLCPGSGDHGVVSVPATGQGRAGLLPLPDMDTIWMVSMHPGRASQHAAGHSAGK